MRCLVFSYENVRELVIKCSVWKMFDKVRILSVLHGGIGIYFLYSKSLRYWNLERKLHDSDSKFYGGRINTFMILNFPSEKKI